MALQHLRSSTANKRPTPGAMADGQLAVNTEATSPGLFFKNASGSLVKVGPVHVGSTAPNASPASGGETGNTLGEQWLDTSVSPSQLKTWNGSAWVSDFPDEIPVSKLADGAARQLLQTDAAGTGVEWTSNVDIPGTLDVTGAAVFDSTTSATGSSTAASFIPSSSTVPTNGVYLPAANTVGVATNGSQRISVDGSGNINIDSNTVYVDAVNNRVGVGTSSPGAKLDVSGNILSDSSVGETVFSSNANWNYGNFYLRRNTSNTALAKMLSMMLNADNPADTTLTNYLNIWGSYSGTPTTGSTSVGLSAFMNLGAPSGIALHTNGSERCKLDSSGRLLVGTSSARSTGGYTPQFEIEGASGPASSASLIANINGAPGPCLFLGKSRGTTLGSNTVVQANDELGNIIFTGADGTDIETIGASIVAFVDGTPGANDMPGRLVFSVTSDNSSSPTERLRISSNGAIDTYGNLGVLNVRSNTAAGTGVALFDAYHSASTTANGTRCLLIYTNGNVQNTNNSYGSLSDLKLKENVVDAASQWEDIKALQVRKYNFKEETGQETHTQIGLIAQEVEPISPGLVYESPDRDAEGNDLGTVTKSVNYSVLYMKAVKALQEAMERIETLEAKVAAIESA